MIDAEVILPFIVAATLIELTPGPNMGYLAALSAAEGRVAGFKAVLGITLGLTFYMVLAVVGVAEAIGAIPLLYHALRWAGVVYLLFLAWEAWRGSEETSSENIRQNANAPFWRGLIANLLNPKAVVFYVTLLPGFISTERTFWVQAFILGAAHLLISLLVHSAIVMAAARAGDLVNTSGDSKPIRRALAIGIALIAVWLAWETR